MKARFRVDGMRELERALLALPTSTSRRVSRRGMIAAMQPVADAARQRAPRDRGELADSIVVSDKLSKREAAKARRSAANGKNVLQVYAGAGALPHAHLVEFGTAPHINGGRFAGSRHPGTAPQPFLRPAWDENKQAVLASLVQHLRVQIDLAVARAARRAAARAARGQ